jgi:AcrR family transcriptional regulator
MGIKERRGREEKARLTSIIAAAENVFAERGYHQARMDDIAEAAELAKGTLYYYFKSKDEIYVHRTRITETSTFIEALQQTLDFYLEYFDKNQGYLKMFLPCMFGFVRFEGDEALKESAKSYEYHGDFIREVLKKKMSREKVPFNPDELLKFIKTLQIGIGIKLLEGHKAEAKAAAHFFIGLIKRVMEESK